MHGSSSNEGFLAFSQRLEWLRCLRPLTIIQLTLSFSNLKRLEPFCGNSWRVPISKVFRPYVDFVRNMVKKKRNFRQAKKKCQNYRSTLEDTKGNSRTSLKVCEVWCTGTLKRYAYWQKIKRIQQAWTNEYVDKAISESFHKPLQNQNRPTSKKRRPAMDEKPTRLSVNTMSTSIGRLNFLVKLKK